MQAQLLFRAARADWSTPLSCHLVEKKLGIAWVNGNRHDAGQSLSLSLLEIEVESGSVINRLSAPCSCLSVVSIQMAYDSQKQHWLVAQVEDFHSSWPSRLMLYRLSATDPALSGHPLTVDEAVNTMTDMGPVLLVDSKPDIDSILYLKPESDYLDSPDVCLGWLIKGEGEEHLAFEAITKADKALGRLSDQQGFLLACRSEYGEFAEKEDGAFVGSTAQWRTVIIGWKRDEATIDWSYAPSIGLPVGDRGNAEADFEWLKVSADAIASPTLFVSGRQIFVVGIVLLDAFDYQAHGYSLEDEERITRKVQVFCCIDSMGEVVEICQSQIGLQLHLCQTGRTVIGVDFLDAHRRLWNWLPLQKTDFHAIVELDQQVIRASVMAPQSEEEHEGMYFWLIEEYSKYVKVSKRDALTLAEIAPTVVLTDIHLLSMQANRGDLDREKPLGTMVYHNTLLILGVDKDNQLMLYRIA